MEPIMNDRSTPRIGRAVPLALLPLFALALLAFQCQPPLLPRSGAQLYLSPQVAPMALSNDGTRLYVANTTSGTLSVLDASNALAPTRLAEVKVGHDPTSVAVLPGLVNGDELVFVVNHISDSISVVSRNKLAVVQTIQELDADGVTRTNEPVSIAFAGPSRAFVTLDEPNQVLVFEIDSNGRASINPTRLAITAQAPRGLAVAGGKLFVASAESGNQTEFPTCFPEDPRGLVVNENDAARTDEGCEISTELFGGINPNTLQLQLGTIFEFAAVDPNIGGRVIRDIDIPDRDLFVFDAQTLALEQTVDTVGTLLAGVAAHALPTAGPLSNTRVWVAHTEARNEIDGLGNLDNHLFENRVAALDCVGGSCTPAQTVDLDDSAAAAGLGQTVPNPWGIAVSGDGNTVVVTAAAADGDPGDGRSVMHGVFTLDRDGNVQGSALVGALPEGVTVRSGPSGEAQVAYVLNTADSSVSVVDLADPQHPATVGSALVVGSDPTPAQIRLGRIAFHTARGSTNKTFACGSCHPNGNIDQLQWVINSVNAPDDGIDAGGQFAEPRTTQPIRGLRNTLPLHWEGVLADPIPGVNPEAAAFDSAPDCDINAVGEVGCVRHLVNAALSGPMCQHNTPDGCEVGEGQNGPGGANLPGTLTEEERNAMAAFQLAVAFPPPPSRRPDDKLSAFANQGVADFFTNEDGKGVNTGVGQALNFVPNTCADNPMGCHSLPLTAGTNSNVVGGFDAPSARGMWDRSTLFSNGIFSSQEVLQGAQDCADGTAPGPKTFNVNLGGSPQLVTITGDPCNLHSPEIETFLFPLAELPFPTGETVWDPAVGMTERGSFVATFEGLFALVYGVRGDAIWEFQVEFGTGLPGLVGRQVSIDPANLQDPEMLAQLDLIERYAREGRITAVAEGHLAREMRYDPQDQAWRSSTSGWLQSSSELLARAADFNEVITVTADLPENISIGGADRQPLLDVDPDARALEVTGDPPTLPRPFEAETATFRLGAEYVDAAGLVLVDGDLCEGCTFTPTTAPATGANAIDLTINLGLSRGVHVVQVQNPNGYPSNEMPICVANVEFGRPLPPADEESCRPYDMTREAVRSENCANLFNVTDCVCDAGADGMVRSCGPTPRGSNLPPRSCTLDLYCFNGSTCDDATVTGTCVPR
jgi:YVTN family beta-propeller protein